MRSLTDLSCRRGVRLWRLEAKLAAKKSKASESSMPRPKKPLAGTTEQFRPKGTAQALLPVTAASAAAAAADTAATVQAPLRPAAVPIAPADEESAVAASRPSASDRTQDQALQHSSMEAADEAARPNGGALERTDESATESDPESSVFEDKADLQSLAAAEFAAGDTPDLKLPQRGSLDLDRQSRKRGQQAAAAASLPRSSMSERTALETPPRFTPPSTPSADEERAPAPPPLGMAEHPASLSIDYDTEWRSALPRKVPWWRRTGPVIHRFLPQLQILLVWGAFAALQLLKQLVPQCSDVFWVIYAVQLAIMPAASLYFVWRKLQQLDRQPPPPPVKQSAHGSHLSSFSDEEPGRQTHSHATSDKPSHPHAPRALELTSVQLAGRNSAAERPSRPPSESQPPPHIIHGQQSQPQQPRMQQQQFPAASQPTWPPALPDGKLHPHKLDSKHRPDHASAGQLGAAVPGQAPRGLTRGSQRVSDSVGDGGPPEQLPYYDPCQNLTWRRVSWCLIMTTIAGLVGGLLGIGGGMVMGPLLLAVGMQPQVCDTGIARFVR